MDAADTRKCPFCAEEIKAEALVCRYCHGTIGHFSSEGESLAPAYPPPRPPDSGVPAPRPLPPTPRPIPLEGRASDEPQGHDWWLASDGRWYPPQSLVKTVERLGSGLTAALRVLFFLTAGLAVLAAALMYIALAMFNTALRAESTSAVHAWISAQDAAVGATAGMALSWLVALILLLVWGKQAYKAASQRATAGRRWSSGWAVGGWFIPAANLVIPKLVFNEIDRMSAPMFRPATGGPAVGERWQSSRLIRAGNWWWFLLIAGLICTGAGVIAAQSATLGGSLPDEVMYRTGMWALIVGPSVVAASLFAGEAYVRELAQRLGAGARWSRTPAGRPEVPKADWMRPYRSSGACPLRALPVLFVWAVGGGICLGFLGYWGGWLAYWLTSWLPFRLIGVGGRVVDWAQGEDLVGTGAAWGLVAIVFLTAAAIIAVIVLSYPIGLGSWGGQIVGAVAAHGKCRNVGVVTAFGLLGGVATWGALALTGLLAGGAVHESSRVLMVFPSVRETLTPAVLAMDAALVVLSAVLSARKDVKKTPFCEACQKWYALSREVTIPVGTAVPLMRALASGSAEGLAPVRMANPGRIELRFQRCECASADAVLTADVMWVKTKRRNGQVSTKNKSARWFQTTLPAAFGTALEHALTGTEQAGAVASAIPAEGSADAGIPPTAVGSAGAVTAGRPEAAGSRWPRRVGVIAYGVVLVGLAVGAYVLWGPEGAPRTDDAALVSISTTSPISATSTPTLPETTTTTVDPALRPALAYFELLARHDDASASQAADEATGDAATYADYLAAADHSGATGDLTEENGVITVCYPKESGEAEDCDEYSDFSLTAGKLQHFSVDGRPLRTRMWRESQLGVGWCRSYGECNWDAPASDSDSLYVTNRYAYISPAGGLWVVWEVQTGRRDLDVMITGGRLASYMTDPAGVKHYADWCGSPIANAELSSLGVRLEKNQQGYLTCNFPGLERTGADTAVTVTLVIDWGGRPEFEYELPELPDQ